MILLRLLRLINKYGKYTGMNEEENKDSSKKDEEK